MSTLAIRALITLALVAGIFGTGWMMGSNHNDKGWRARADQQTIDAQTEAMRQADQMAVIDRVHTEQLKVKQDEIDRLRTRVAAGTVRLRVSARCPVSTATGSSGVGDGTPGGSQPAAGSADRPELDRAAEPAYFSLKDGLTRQAEQLRACQAIIASERGPK